jgi:hypothetical protein
MDESARQVAPADAAALRQMIMGFRATQLIHVAARLGLADRLARGAQTPAALAQQAGAEPDALRRVLRALASLGIFAETADGAYALTPLAEPLCSDRPGSLHSTALLYGAEFLWRAYGHMEHSVRTGRPGFDDVHGASLFAYLADDAAAAALFHGAMAGFSDQEAAAILAAYDYAAARSVVDVGGGQGRLLSALLLAHPHLGGVVLDLATAQAGANALLADAGLAARARFVAGDFFAAVPGGGDLYLLKSVIHNWDDGAAITILRRCRAAMADHARLLLIERVVPAGNAPAEAKLFDVNMLVVVGGRERTAEEYRALLAQAGLALVQVIPTASPLSLVEARPI